MLLSRRQCFAFLGLTAIPNVVESTQEGKLGILLLYINIGTIPSYKIEAYVEKYKKRIQPLKKTLGCCLCTNQKYPHSH